MAPSAFLPRKIGRRVSVLIKGTCATSSCRHRRHVLRPARERWHKSERTNKTPICHAASQRRNHNDTNASSVTVTEETRSGQESTEEASRRVLEWNEICRQVSCFASTSMGAEALAAHGLHLPSCRQESELLLEQTSQALSVDDLSFEGIYDITPGIAILTENAHFVFTPEQLNIIGVTLRSAFRMHKTLEENAARASLLYEMAQSLTSVTSELVKTLERSIRASDGFILDEASKDLARCRAERRENAEKLQRETDAWAQKLFKERVCERPIVVFRRDRRCLPVKNGRQGQLPKGSVRLAQSSTGSTVYMEPEPVVQLNNLEALLHSQIRHHERRVLVRLSKHIFDELDAVKEVLETVKVLDIVYARAKYANWIGGVRPRFWTTTDEGSEDWQVCIPGAVHPLLLEQALEPLPKPPSKADKPFQNDFQPPIETAVLPLNRAKEKKSKTSTGIQHDRPQPLELMIPRSKAVVALTGPNTGGKTGTMKTLGLCILMAKSGLYVPVEADPTRVSIGVHMKWFDKVFADIGDSQSLQQSLSTFSGHVRRLTHILDKVCENSLVLLDEIGTGTDPTEGAALAAAVLMELSQIAGLTIATTHHAEIKELADTHPLFMNASMEFNAATLKPTYRLIWESTGQSNALDVCTALKFDPAVVQEAKQILKTGILQAEKDANVEESLKEKLQETFSMRDELLKTQKEAKKKLHQLEKELQKMKTKEKKLQGKLEAYQIAPSAADTEVDWILEELKKGELTFEEAESCFQELLDNAPHPETDSPGKDLVWFPQFGETVRLKHLGGRLGKVLSKKPRKTVQIECQNMRLDMPIWYIEPVDPQDARTEAESMEDPQHTAYFTGTQTSAHTLDIRGMSVEDALEQLEHAIEKRLDVVIIHVLHHGCSGRVKAAVRNYLQQCHRVRDFVEETDSEEGDCTAVALW